MYKIYKYPLEIADTQILKLPIYAKILSAISKDNNLFIYALVDTSLHCDDIMEREIQIYGTGNPVDEWIDNLLFIGTVTTHNGTGVWHIFENIGGN